MSVHCVKQIAYAAAWVAALPFLGWTGGLDLPEGDSLLSGDMAAHSGAAPSQMRTESWPQGYGLQMNGMINASFTCYGQIGLGFYPRALSSPRVNFETPAGSQVEYLSGGALWIGGIVGTDTLVSVGADGWRWVHELRPTDSLGTVYPFSYASDRSMVAELTDTTPVASLDVVDDRPHQPLGVRILNRSHALTSSPANNCIFYDMAITNIGGKNIRQAYVGWFVDGDVGLMADQNRAQDDLAGSLDDGTAYIIDNDGDQTSNHFVCPKIFALKFLSTSFGGQPSYNWWISNGSPAMDFGPQTKAKFRGLPWGSMGTPEGDRNKYAFLSNGEWDYDQVMTASITSDDSVWIYPNQAIAGMYSQGTDTRFLLSIGPFDLDPDSTVYIRYTTYTGNNIHYVINNWRNNLWNEYAPTAYLANLDFADVLSNAQAAELVAPSLFSPLNPPSGFRTAYSDSTSIGLRWDTIFNAGMGGYNIYEAEVPDTAYVHDRVFPPWFRPTDWRKIGEIGMTGHYTVTGLSPCKWYAFAATVRNDEVEGPIGNSPWFGKLKSESPPAVTDTLLFAEHGTPTTITWTGGSAKLGIYRIYKFTDPALALNPYLPFYSQDSVQGTTRPVDTVVRGAKTNYYYALTPYAELPGDITIWTDPSWSVDAVYRITAVDSCGFESPFSPLIRSIDATRTGDILILYGSQSFTNPYDSIRAFYSDILGSRYRYDFYNVADSLSGLCTSCFDWRDFMRYRLIIADGGLDDAIIDMGLGNPDPYASAPFEKFLLSGGRLVYCGNLNSLQFLSSKFTATDFGIRPVVLGGAQYFDIDSIVFAGPKYYSRFNPPSNTDTVFGFRGAAASRAELPDLVYDTSTFLPTWLTPYCQSKTAPGVGTFRLHDSSRVLYRYRSLYPDQSKCEDHPVGVITEENGCATYLFGFHLWYLQRQDVRQLVDWIMNGQAVANHALINELLADNRAAQADQNGEYDSWIELHNPSDFPVALRKCYLSDNVADITKWTIPDTVISAHGHLMVWADEDTLQAGLHADFALLKSGGTVILSDSTLTVLDSVTFGPQTTDRSLGRCPNGRGPFFAQSPSFGLPNNCGAACCTGTTGNVDLAGTVDLSDLTALVSYLTGCRFVPQCEAQANVNGKGIVDLADLSALVYYLTGGAYVLPNCP